MEKVECSKVERDGLVSRPRTKLRKVLASVWPTADLRSRRRFVCGYWHPRVLKLQLGSRNNLCAPCCLWSYCDVVSVVELWVEFHPVADEEEPPQAIM